MGIIAGLGVMIGAYLLFLYPFFVWWERSVAPDELRMRRREWKILAAKLILVELQMITATNAMRKALGQAPTNAKPIADKLNSVDWKELKMDATTMARAGIEEIEGKLRIIR